MTKSLQKAAFEQRRVLDHFLGLYERLEPEDPRLQGMHGITGEFCTRNYSVREALSNVLCDLLLASRPHYLVKTKFRAVAVFGPIIDHQQVRLFGKNEKQGWPHDKEKLEAAQLLRSFRPIIPQYSVVASP